ncbi:MAG: peptidylprolyl isomerase [Myxococcota bacterium]
MRSNPLWSALALAAVALAGPVGCEKEAADTAQSEPAKSATPSAAADTGKTDKPAETGAARPAPDGEKPKAEPAGDKHPAMYDPSQATETAPDTFKAKFETSKGDFVIEVTRKWSPNGADRFWNLIKIGYFDDVKFFRVVPGFMAQFGIHGDPAVNKHWSKATIPDDMVAQSNTRGYVTFAKTGLPNSRSTQLFINFVDRNKFLDGQGFSPFGKIVEGMEVVDALEGKYGEQPSRAQPIIQRQGNAFLDEKFPDLDHIVKATLVE